MSHPSRPPHPHGGPDPDRPIREGNARMAPLWQVLVGREVVRRHVHLILAAGLVLAGLGVAVMIDAFAGAVHIPERWFGLLLLADGMGSLGAGMVAAGAARRLRIFKGLFLSLAAILIMMASASSFFLLAMLFGTAFLVDGAIRIILAYLLTFSGWRTSAALGALSVAFGLFHLQPWPTWYVGTVGYCIGMFLILNGARLALAGLRTRRTAPEPDAAPAADASESLTVYVWTPTGQATTPARQRLIRRYVASVDVRGRFSTGHAALEQGGDLYVSHYPAVEIDRSRANLRSSLRAGPENDVPGRFLPSHRDEVADWCEATVAVTLHGVDAGRLRRFWDVYRRDTTYNFISRNCSTTVAHALDVAVEGAFNRSGHPWQSLAKALTSPEFWAAALLRNGARSMTWTPGLVLDYARALSALIDPVSPVPSIAWSGVGRRFVRNWRTGSLTRLYQSARRRSAPDAGPTEA
ncbi:DUF4105 domain-containing protein [Methylobacterium sp. NEAU K]|uniref:lipoprotein N-acyltransferase Lnb domain-containing protein n=1 Tax=Methylobacterium sp. NEAU K TaxID=3064946 RepID=UPI0027362DFC|nr:DUF4105 domain-containing protein [Methylobacterium sp. NEAU K]MDP4005695.1 DUF4105 domain-containing protein [Methylobacterium sp. NEAU K]